VNPADTHGEVGVVRNMIGTADVILPITPQCVVLAWPARFAALPRGFSGFKESARLAPGLDHRHADFSRRRRAPVHVAFREIWAVEAFPPLPAFPAFRAPPATPAMPRMD
jgi:hypothetical protein